MRPRIREVAGGGDVADDGASAVRTCGRAVDSTRDRKAERSHGGPLYEFFIRRPEVEGQRVRHRGEAVRRSDGDDGVGRGDATRERGRLSDR